jgi:RNA polymerase sigma-70 factor (ECF subfamily)
MDDVLTSPKPLSLNSDEILRGAPSTEDFVTDLYVKLRPSLISYVYHLIGSTRDAEDVVQIAFIQLFDQINENAEIRNIRGWLYRVVHNLAIDQVRSASRREAFFREWLADYEDVSDEESAEQALIRREQIEKSLELLNEREQRCLMLRVEGLSYQEIAEIIDTTPKSVSVYLARGLKKFESRHEDKKR